MPRIGKAMASAGLPREQYDRPELDAELAGNYMRDAISRGGTGCSHIGLF